MIKSEKWQQLREWMEQLDIAEDDLTEKFIVGSGSGGQKLHKTSSCVYLRHATTGIEIKCQQHRSRELNRYEARQRLCHKIEELAHNIKSAKQKAAEKIKRQKQRRSRRAKQKMLDDKSHRAQLKKNRAKPPT